MSEILASIIAQCIVQLYSPAQMPPVYESMNAQKRQCPSCMVIWLLCLFEDTGAWDGGDMLRLGSRMMLERINRQQWLLLGFELMCE